MWAGIEVYFSLDCEDTSVMDEEAGDAQVLCMLVLGREKLQFSISEYTYVYNGSHGVTN